MEYVQEQVTTLHDYGDVSPTAPVDRATVVVPMTERDHTSLAAERVLSTLERVNPERVLIPLRADKTEVSDVVGWVNSFDLPAEVLWCTAPQVESFLETNGLDGNLGKGRDVWLGLGVASQSEYVAIHDADATTYDETLVSRLLYPLANGYDFSKGYYARVENDRLYGRLFRLFYRPLVRALAEEQSAPLLSYLEAFRYALAGEFAMTGEVARQLHVPRGWGLEIGTLGDTYDAAGFDGTAQVDLGVHEHDHRSVGGPDGLGEMCTQVGAALFTILEDHGIEPEYTTLPDRYREAGTTLVDQYAADAGFNNLEYDRDRERQQVDVYADTIAPLGVDDRLPAWEDAPIAPEDIALTSRNAIEETLSTNGKA